MTTEAEQRFAAAWRAKGAPQPLLLAVSGGGDSMALMRLSAPLARAGAIVAVATVDHGLRPGSAADADFVIREAGSLELSAVRLAWEGEKPTTGVQGAARAARYRLLAGEAARIGAGAIFTAHTANDLAETILMRMSHRTGVRGLAGMAVESLIADGAGTPRRLLRLLLGERRAALRYYLERSGASFVDDPSNDDLRFERVRVRRAIEATPDREAIIVNLVGLASRARGLQAISDRLAALEFRRAGGAFLADGSVRIGPFSDPSLAARLLQAVGAGDHAPDAAAAAAAFGAAFSGRRMSLAGALVEAEPDGLLIRREPAAIFGRAGDPGIRTLLLAPGEKILWDRRFAIENTFATPVAVGPVGPAAKAVDGPALPALETAPGLFIDGTLAAFPGDAGDGDCAVQNLVPERFDRAVIRF